MLTVSRGVTRLADCARFSVLSRGGGFGPNCAVDCADVNKTYPTNYNSMREKTELIKHRMLSVAS